MERSYKRPGTKRSVGRKIVIACEGKKTEKGYFEAIRQHFRLGKGRIVIVDQKGNDPKSVVIAAIDQVKTAKSQQRWMIEDAAWAVFDGDEHIENDWSNWNAALQMAQANQIHLAISNPCFELWYVLHFQDSFAHISKDRVQHLLKLYVPNYSKASVLFPNPLHAKTEEAIRRALAMSNQKLTEQERHANPSTRVGVLVDSLFALT